MAKYMRYDMDVLLREDRDGKEGMERALRSKVTACSEHEARRMVLERAWASQLLVSRFISIKVRGLK